MEAAIAISTAPLITSNKTFLVIWVQWALIASMVICSQYQFLLTHIFESILEANVPWSIDLWNCAWQFSQTGLCMAANVESRSTWIVRDIFSICRRICRAWTQFRQRKHAACRQRKKYTCAQSIVCFGKKREKCLKIELQFRAFYSCAYAWGSEWFLVFVSSVVSEMEWEGGRISAQRDDPVFQMPIPSQSTATIRLAHHTNQIWWDTTIPQIYNRSDCVIHQTGRSHGGEWILVLKSCHNSPLDVHFGTVGGRKSHVLSFAETTDIFGVASSSNSIVAGAFIRPSKISLRGTKPEKAAIFDGMCWLCKVEFMGLQHERKSLCILFQCRISVPHQFGFCPETWFWSIEKRRHDFKL